MDIKTLDGKIVLPENFCHAVEERVWMVDEPYMDAVIFVCKDLNVEIDRVSSLINRSIQEKIEREAQDLNFLEKPVRLPL